MMRQGQEAVGSPLLTKMESSFSVSRVWVYGLISIIVISIVKALLDLSGIFHPALPASFDFIDFFRAAQSAFNGTIAREYRIIYPPQFPFFLAPLGSLSFGMAYAVFIIPAAALYVWLLSPLSGDRVLLLLLLSIIPIEIVIHSGQNGLITGTLVALASIGIVRQRWWAGVPLGLLIIKPHLAVAIGLYIILSRSWRTAIAAMLTIGLVSGMTQMYFGVEIWRAFLQSWKTAGAYIHDGGLPIYRMCTPYAALLASGAPFRAAIGVQIVTAISAVTAMILMIRRKWPLHRTLGVVIICTPLLTPYFFDYDLPVVIVGFALLIEDIIKLMNEQQRMLLYALIVFVGGVGLAQQTILAKFLGEQAPRAMNLTGVAYVLATTLLWFGLTRGARQERRIAMIPI